MNVTVDLMPFHENDLDKVVRAHVYPSGPDYQEKKRIFWVASLWTGDETIVIGFADGPKGHRTNRALLRWLADRKIETTIRLVA